MTFIGLNYIICNMLSSNESLVHEDLIRPLSLEALQYFASGVIPVAESYETSLFCKFIRLGDAMMLGAAIDFGEEDWRGKKRSIQHVNLLEFLELDGETYAIAGAAAASEPFTRGGRYPGVFSDGGFATIRANGSTPTKLVLGGESYDYGRADEAGRQRSGEVAQLLVGDAITVTTRE